MIIIICNDYIIFIRDKKQWPKKVIKNDLDLQKQTKKSSLPKLYFQPLHNSIL